MIDREFERKLYSLYKLIDFYLNDSTAVELRQYLEDAIKSMLGDLSETLNEINLSDYIFNSQICNCIECRMKRKHAKKN